VVEVLTGTDNPRRYWSDLKRKLKAEGSELYEKIIQLKMTAEDGKTGDPRLAYARLSDEGKRLPLKLPFRSQLQAFSSMICTAKKSGVRHSFSLLVAGEGLEPTTSGL
jgi:hypothetical protein